MIEDEDEDEDNFASNPTQAVSILWLMKAFALSRYKVERKLVGLQPVGKGLRNHDLYYLPDAAARLVKPENLDLSAYIETIGPDALPARLRASYWTAQLSKQRWEERAGELWHTNTVIEKLSLVLSSMRVKLQLIVDQVERESSLTIEQRYVIAQIVDSVQQEMYDDILEFSKSGKTLSQLGLDREEFPEKPNRNNDDVI